MNVEIGNLRFQNTMKDRLRAAILKKRTNMPLTEVTTKSELIRQKLFALSEFVHAQTILFYVSYGNEVCTHQMIKDCLQKGKTIAIPKTEMKPKKLVISQLTCWDDLTCGAYNILEPKPNCLKKIDPKQIDCIIVPGIAFDAQGNRIGHGKGYYDSLLKEFHHVPKIGLVL